MSAGAEPKGERDTRQVKIVSHSNLFYWWPVWVTGLLMALLTYLDGSYLRVVPKDTKAAKGVTVPDAKGPRDVLYLPEGEHLPTSKGTNEPEQPEIRVSMKAGYGVVFTVVLLLVIFITNVPLRGMWSVLLIVILFMGSIIMALTGAWEDVLELMAHSRIYINAFGYLAISVPLFLLWLAVVLFFDRQIYMIFTPGQLRVHQDIGGGEVAYDTLGMVVEKRRSDLFRHWILGIGSGDLVVKTSGAGGQHFEMPNVLFIGAKVQTIQQMLQQREVVGS